MERLDNLSMQEDIMRDVRHSNLDIVKDELREESLRAGTIEIVGPLANAEARANWTGTISLDTRLASGELSETNIQAAVEAMAGCYVPTALGARLRCVDGRGEADYDDGDPEHFGQKLGPQIAAGTVGEAVDYRVTLGEASSSDINLNKDVETLDSKEDEYKPGNHTAVGHADDKTGCGALDGVERQEAKVSAEPSKEVENAEQALLADSFSSRVFDAVSQSTANLMSSQETYFKDKNASLDIIANDDPEGVPALSGTHKEFIVSVNTVPGTTLHRDHFSSMFDGKVQAFNYDFWRTAARAKTLFEDNEEQQAKYIHAQVARTIAVLMDLTDGSLILAVRRPR